MNGDWIQSLALTAVLDFSNCCAHIAVLQLFMMMRTFIKYQKGTGHCAMYSETYRLSFLNLLGIRDWRLIFSPFYRWGK